MNSWKSVGSLETADHFKLRKGKVRGTDAVGFPYFHDGRVTGYKLRSIELPKKEGAFSIIGSPRPIPDTRNRPPLGHATIWKESSIPWPAMKPAYGTSYPSLTGPSHPVLPGEILNCLPGEIKPSFEGLKRMSSPQTTCPR